MQDDKKIIDVLMDDSIIIKKEKSKSLQESEIGDENEHGSNFKDISEILKERGTGYSKNSYNGIVKDQIPVGESKNIIRIVDILILLVSALIIWNLFEVYL